MSDQDARSGAHRATEPVSEIVQPTPPRTGRISPPPPAPRDVVRTVARGLGQTLITAGLVVLLFVAYELWITNIFSDHKQHEATQALDRSWDAAPDAGPAGTSGSAGSSGTGVTGGTAGAGSSGAAPAGAVTATATQVVTVTDPNKLVTDPGVRTRSYQTFDGQGFAKIYIPSFGPDFVYTVIEGTTPSDLDVGPGHYADSQYPGEIGNFAMAGHRVSKGSPFNQLGLLSSCDALVIETKDDWFVYRVLPMQDEASGWNPAQHAHCTSVTPLTGAYGGVFGREITDPSDYAQVEPVPHVNSTAVPTDAQRLITLTTCHPQFSDAQRMIIHGVLTKDYKKSGTFTPPELLES